MPDLSGNTSRYAIYFCPSPTAPLYGQGSQWLGRDATTGAVLDPDLPEHIRNEEWLQVTDSPRRYGFHATLKPPFRLAEDATFEDLKAALRDLALRHFSFYASPLCVRRLGSFLALTLSAPSDEFCALAADSVSEFDRFRAPATEKELAQRLRDSMSPREHEHVLRWGYPYVFDTWKFHMSLTRSLSSESLPQLEQFLGQRFAPVCEQPLLVDSICIFHETHPGAHFHLLDRVYLRSA
jgi:putative phosphonate metabolism protein